MSGLASGLVSNSMTAPRFWLKHWRARRAVTNYPLYDVPHKKAEELLPEAQALENYDYFLRVRLTRLEFFRDWLSQNFRLNATLDGSGILAVSEWAEQYGGGLVGDESFIGAVFANYQPVWKGQFAGYNAIVDMGIFIGEYLISKRPRLHWEFYRGPPAGSGETEGSNMMRPHVGGFPRYWGFDAWQRSYGCIAGSRQRSKLGQVRKRGPREGLIYSCKTLLAHANMADDCKPFFTRDYSNEPL